MNNMLYVRRVLTPWLLALLVVGCSTTVDLTESAERQLREIENSRLSPDIPAGTWRGVFVYPNGESVGTTFEVTTADPLTGTITFNNSSADDAPCKSSVNEQSRTSSTVTVTTRATSGPSDCADSGRWELGMNSSTLTGELVWSPFDHLIGSRIQLKRRS